MKEIRGRDLKEDYSLVYCSLVLVPVTSSSGAVVYKRLGVGFVVDEGWAQGAIERNLQILQFRPLRWFLAYSLQI
jgi:hypothetical protein